MPERLRVAEIIERYPHLDARRIHNAGYGGRLNRSRGDDDRWRYHLDETFERWQAKYLTPRRRHIRAVEAGDGASDVPYEILEHLPARLQEDDPAARALRRLILDRAAMLLIERAGLLAP